MKKIKYLVAASALVVASGCGDEFLSTDNLYQKGLDNFYKTPTDIEEAMGGVYNALYVGGVHSEEHVAANLMGDEMLGGGGPDDKSAKNVDSFQDPEEDTYKDLWVETYNGVYRCNAIIEKASSTDFSNFFKTPEEAEAFKNQTIGEAYFMRGFLMFRAAKLFGGMPLVLATDAPRNVGRSTISETFGQIASDIMQGINYMPAVKASVLPTERYGHANKWIAQGYLARVFLFYTGYMTNIEKTATDAIVLPDGSTLAKSDVIGAVEDCISNSGYALLSDFRNLWPYSFVNESSKMFNPEGPDAVLPWAKTEGLEWAGQDGFSPRYGTGNSEVMFALRYAYGNWGWSKGQSYNNRVPLFFGIRDNSMVPFGQGWGWGTIHPLVVDLWDDEDVRKEGSILKMGDAEQGTGGYQANKGDHETGYFNKKYTTVQHGGADGVKGMFYYLYDMDNGDPMQLWAAQDFYYLRFADVLLMHSELTETNSGMNQVRARAGLAPVAYTLDALKQERFHEFAFEGLRWFDMVRWGDVENSAKNFFNDEVDVVNSGVPGKYRVNYRVETKGLVPVPESEIRLSNGAYEQNPGW